MFNILIVEDNPSDSQIMSFVVKKKRGLALTATDAHLALEITQKYRIDMILLDWMLPNVSGLQLLKTFRLQEQLKSIPIILVSGKNELTDVEKAIKSGASDYVVKPVDPVILEGKITKHLKQNLDWAPIPVSNEQHSTASIVHSLKLESISELGVELVSELELPLGASFIFASRLLNEIQIPNPLISVFEREKVGDLFRYKCSLVGMKETDLQKIRLFLRLMQIDSDSKAS